MIGLLLCQTIMVQRTQPVNLLGIMIMIMITTTNDNDNTIINTTFTALQ